MPPLRRLLAWHLPLGTALALAALFLAGLVGAVTDRLGRPASEVRPDPAPLPASAEVRIAALGDSMTRGAGDDRGGYPARLRELLVKAGRSVAVDNFAVDGATTEMLLARMTSPVVKESIASASLVVLSISGNDLTHALGRLGAEMPSALAPVLQGSSANVAKTLAAIRAINPKAPIRLVGVYDPASGGDRADARAGLARWNASIEAATFAVPGVLFVPVADLFVDRPDRIADDRFHPGPKGYEAIAARVFSTLPASMTERRP